LQVRETKAMRLAPRWSGVPAVFGSAYTCALTDTVTEGGDEGEGSVEYLVFQKVLVNLAKRYDLHAVTDYDDFDLDETLEEPVPSSDGSALFRRFKPVFQGSHPSLVIASRLNCAFVLRKGPLPDDAEPGAAGTSTAPAADAQARGGSASAHGAAHRAAAKRHRSDEDMGAATAGAGTTPARPGVNAAVAAAAAAEAREAEAMRRLAAAQGAPQFKRSSKLQRNR
jgi:hypothetical protein